VRVVGRLPHHRPQHPAAVEREAGHQVEHADDQVGPGERVDGEPEQAGSIVVLDSGGVPSAIVNEAAVLATPEDRRPWVPVSTVARRLEPGLTFSADIAGEPLILAMQRSPASEYLLLDRDGSVFGVLVTDDVDKAFAAGI
jgi:hypothetical protein